MAKADTRVAETIDAELAEGALEIAEPREQREARLSEHFGAEVRLIEFIGREMPVYQPTKEQLAVMARLRGVGRTLDVLPEGERRNEATVRTVGSIGSTMASFFADQDDWDAIEMALLHKLLDYTKLPDVFELVFAAWSDATEEDNRAARRKDKKARRVTG